MLNVGAAMDLSSGVFTAPRNGKYFFSLSGMEQFPSSSTRVYMGIGLNLNGSQIGATYADEMSTESQFEMISLQSTLSLKAGDAVWLQINTATTGALFFDNNSHHTHFTGWLLEEDISPSLNAV